MFAKALPNRLHLEQPGEEKKAPDTPPMSLTIKELARELHMCEKSAYRLAHEPGFPSFMAGCKLLVNRARLQEWMDSQPTPIAA